MGTLNVGRNAPPPCPRQFNIARAFTQTHTASKGETPRFYPQVTAQAHVHCPEGPKLTLPDLPDRRTAPC